MVAEPSFEHLERTMGSVTFEGMRWPNEDMGPLEGWTFVGEALEVSIDGLFLTPEMDYNVDPSGTITFNTFVAQGSEVKVSGAGMLYEPNGLLVTLCPDDRDPRVAHWDLGTIDEEAGWR